MTQDVIGAKVSALSESVWAFAALSAAVESGLLEALTQARTVPELAARCSVPLPMVSALADVLVGLELATRDGATISPSAELARIAAGGFPLRVLRDDLRRTLGQPAAIIADARSGRLTPGWRHLDEDVIEAQGTFARLHTDLLFVRGIVPACDGLSARLATPGARVLDVGAGAAGNAIGFAEAWTNAVVIGLEPWPASLAIGRRNVAAAGLEQRIVLHELRVEDLAVSDDERFDLIWLPQMFLDGATLGPAIAACVRVLRPGGWLVSAWIADEHAPGLGGAIARLRDVAFGGEARGCETVCAALEAAGLGELRRVPFAGGALGTVAGRRHEASA